MRAVIYARYSSDNQSQASIDDQIEIGRRYIEGKGWTLVDTYEDRALSGASDQRPAYQKLLSDTEAGQFDVIVCEALDRLSRRLADVARLHDQLEFRRIQLHAVNIGQVTTMHVGLLGTMSQLYLSDLKEKTRRGQLGRVLAGKVAGGKAYGYRVVDGQPGTREVNEFETPIIRRIFTEFANGNSPRAIAKKLNAEGVAGPGGRDWRDTTIRGQVERGTGILNNALYVGRIEWNRCSYVKDPRTGKRVARPNPKSLWEIVEVPELRIIDDDLWNAVKVRQHQASFEMQRDTDGNALNRVHRRRFLFSGLLKCGICGGGYTIVAKDRYGCATRRTKGTCNNSATIGRQEIEARVLEGLKDKLMAPELVREFARAFQEEVNRAAAQRDQQIHSYRLQLNAAERKMTAIVEAIEDGRYSRTLGDRLAALEIEKESLQVRLRDTPAAVVRLHPRIADLYAEKVARLEESLSDPEIREQAADLLRSLIARIDLRPRENGNGIDAVLHGDLAQILALCDAPEQGGKPTKGTSARSQLSVVAGVGFEPTTFRL